MVLGLVFSTALLIPAMFFINSGYMLSFYAIQTDSVTGLFSIAGFFMVYCVIVFAVFMMIFSLPQSMPDRILRWIGGGVSDMGEQNSMGRIESGASGHARTAATSVGSKSAQFDSAKREKVRQSEQAGYEKADRAIQERIAGALEGGGDRRGSGREGDKPENV